MGHMNVQYYAAKFDEATWQLFGAIGISPDYLRNANRGMVAIDQKTKYKREVIPGDIVEIGSIVLEMREKSIRFIHIMEKTDSGELVAETEFIGVHIDTITRKACTFSDDVYTAVAKIIAQNKCVKPNK
jgi:acyl-CoA thioester hydrolase